MLYSSGNRVSCFIKKDVAYSSYNINKRFLFSWTTLLYKFEILGMNIHTNITKPIKKKYSPWFWLQVSMVEGRSVASTDIHLLKLAGSLNGRSVHNDIKHFHIRELIHLRLHPGFHYIMLFFKPHLASSWLSVYPLLFDCLYNKFFLHFAFLNYGHYYQGTSYMYLLLRALQQRQYSKV